MINHATLAQIGARAARPVRLLLALTTIALATFATTADAMRVSPMVVEITTRGAGSSARIEVQNVGSTALPFETRITRLEFGEDGEMIETPADEDFLVFPPQGIVPVGGRQVVRVQWIGDPDLALSRAYYVGIHQIPVDLSGDGEAAAVGGQLQVVYNMKSLLTVAPPGAEPQVRVISATPTMVAAAPQTAVEVDPALGGAAPAPETQEMRPGVSVELRNTGTRYAMMSAADWTLEGTGVDGEPLRVVLSATQVNEAVGVGYLAPAGGRRTFDVPTGQAFAPGRPIRVSFSR
ncbi:hypothetical protein [Brevundimonas viscosa]|uniref:Fimbrial chaperone protein n=1 Tax=Brevundimonas viscosa TaxID=871741 RepID=A0A1I6SP45_9CAUL|nr:hypothetical protein [Brevundimonas viscosa]SFS78733.1 fimbrial chaperone protein [Brevundimonas viscosa]